MLEPDIKCFFFHIYLVILGLEMLTCQHVSNSSKSKLSLTYNGSAASCAHSCSEAFGTLMHIFPVQPKQPCVIINAFVL